MEFLYRSIDERGRRSPLPPTVPSTPGSGSADSHGGGGPAERLGNSAMTLWQPDLLPPETAAVDADKLRRQAVKARIRERVLREEMERWDLELEVRSELREQMLRLLWPVLGQSARGSDTPAAPSTGTITAANSSLPTVALEPNLPSPETAAADADELRRQAVKARIRERVLREEMERWELELEVRSELREQMLRLSLPVLGQSARGSDTPVAPSTGTITAANSSLPTVALEAHSKANALATAPTKRKSPDRATGALLVPCSKKQKSTLTCTVCGITASSKKAMEDHLNGKVHKRKVVALPDLPKLVPEIEMERGLEAGEEEAMAMETLGDCKPTKFMMATTAGELNEVTQMDGYLLCELCNVPTKDRITMMCHLQGSKHIANGKKKRQPSSKPLGEAEGTVIAATSAIGSANPKKVVLEDFSLPLPHMVQRLEGFLLCELCDVKEPSIYGMRQHLSGKKHKNKVNASSDASVNMSIGGKEATKAQPVDTDTVVTSDMGAKVEAPLEKSLPKLGDDSEVQERTVAPPKEDVTTGDTAKTAGTEMMKSTSAGAQLNNVCNSDSLTMEVDGVMHPLWRVDGFLVCLSCEAKAPSETTMRSHLAGKKHKLKMRLAAQVKNDLSALATGANEEDNSSKSTKANVEAGLVPSMVPQENTAADKEESKSALPLATPPQTKNTVAMALASMAVDQPAEAQLDTCIIEPAVYCEITEEAGGEHAAAGSNGSATQTKESVRTNDTTAAPGKPIKIQVEGKVFTVTQQVNGCLSCEVCGVHGCNKDSMILHLYTSTHWNKASLAEKKEKEKEKEQACMAAVAMVDKDGEGGKSMASDGSGLLVD